MTDDLVTWLRARLDEDEENAQAALDAFAEGDFDIRWRWLADYRRTKAHTGRSSTFMVGAPTPTEVLADIAAKRALLDLHDSPGGNYCDVCSDDEHGARKPCDTLRLLASAYADRPGYREEWRP